MSDNMYEASQLWTLVKSCGKYHTKTYKQIFVIDDVYQMVDVFNDITIHLSTSPNISIDLEMFIDITPTGRSDYKQFLMNIYKHSEHEAVSGSPIEIEPHNEPCMEEALNRAYIGVYNILTKRSIISRLNKSIVGLSETTERLFILGRESTEHREIIELISSEVDKNSQNMSRIETIQDTQQKNINDLSVIFTSHILKMETDRTSIVQLMDSKLAEINHRLDLLNTKETQLRDFTLSNIRYLECKRIQIEYSINSIKIAVIEMTIICVLISIIIIILYFKLSCQVYSLYQ